MVTIYDLKPRFQALLRPLCRSLVRAGVTANQITLSACILSFGYGMLLFLSQGARIWLLFLPVILFARMALNAIDGMLARDYGQKSRLGGLLNEVTDVISDAALYLPFAAIAGFPVLPAIIAVVMAGLTEMTGAVSQAIGGRRRYDGPMGKSDRAFAYGLLGVLIGLGFGASWWLEIYMWVLIALLGVTIFNRGRGALQEESSS